MVPLLPLLVAARAGLRLLPLAYDDWDTGHELPDLVDGRLFGDTIFVRVENRGGGVRRGVTLSVEGDGEYLEASAGAPVDLQPGQRTSVHAPLRQRRRLPADACPLTLRVVLEALEGQSEAVTKVYRLLCRKLDDRFSFVYLDADGSPQLAAAK